MISKPEMELEEVFTRVNGYVELGMYRDALAELQSLEPTDSGDRAEIAKTQMPILRQMEDWPALAKLARESIVTNPDWSTFYLEGATGIRYSESVNAAMKFLMSGEHCLAWTAEFWFRRGCYNCALGDLEEVKRCVYMAIGGGEEQYVRRAQEDEDLKPLRGTWVLD